MHGRPRAAEAGRSQRQFGPTILPDTVNALGSTLGSAASREVSASTTTGFTGLGSAVTGGHAMLGLAAKPSSTVLRAGKNTHHSAWDRKLASSMCTKPR